MKYLSNRESDPKICGTLVDFARAYIQLNPARFQANPKSIIDLALNFLNWHWFDHGFRMLRTLLATFDKDRFRLPERIFIPLFYLLRGYRVELWTEPGLELGKGALLISCLFVAKYGFESTKIFATSIGENQILGTISETIGFVQLLGKDPDRKVVIAGLCEILTKVHDLPRDLLKDLVRILSEFIFSGAATKHLQETEALLDQKELDKIIVVLPTGSTEERKFLVDALAKYAEGGDFKKAALIKLFPPPLRGWMAELFAASGGLSKFFATESARMAVGNMQHVHCGIFFHHDRNIPLIAAAILPAELQEIRRSVF